MIYLDASVALAHVLVEERAPPDELWADEVVSSRLLEYEVWNRLHASGSAAEHGDVARALLARVELVELRPDVLDRALRPFPKPVRTLDAMHLATMSFLAERGHDVRLATYDRRMTEAAEAMGIAGYPLG